MGDITKNFSFYEFRPKGAPKSWLPSSEYRKKLIVNLAKNLQVVRSAIPKGSYMVVTNSVRTLADFDRLTDAGYKPSKTSDHLAGVAVALSPGSKKFKKYGATYNFAVGAVDIIPKNGLSVYDLFKLAVKLDKTGKCDFGQIIYEKDPKRGKEWVHFGGSLKSIFSDDMVKFIGRIKYMKSTDGGRSYQSVRNP